VNNNKVNKTCIKYVIINGQKSSIVWTEDSCIIEYNNNSHKFDKNIPIIDIMSTLNIKTFIVMS
jgi:hypothetical protein